MLRTLIIVAAVTLLASPLEARAKWYRCRHEVLPGETISIVARRYKMSAKRLRNINRLKSDSVRAGRKPGIVSRFPCRPRHKVIYRVKRRDTLARIARKHRLDLRLVRRLNPKARRGLKVGQKILLVVEGPQQVGKGKGFYQMHSGVGYTVRTPRRAWGTYLAVTRLIEVLSAHYQRFPKGDPIKVDDLSVKGGGRLPPHISHRTGRDVDIRYPLKIKTKYYVKANAKTLDVRRSWDLIHAFVKTNDVVYVFVDHSLQKLLYEHAKANKVPAGKLKKWFQYPRSKRSMYGIIRHEPGHATHLHVRFRKAGPGERPNS